MRHCNQVEVRGWDGGVLITEASFIVTNRRSTATQRKGKPLIFNSSYDSNYNNRNTWTK